MDLMRKALYLGLGTIALTKEKAEQVVDEMVKSGHLEKGEASRMVKDLVEKGQQQSDQIEQAVKQEVAQMRADLGVVTRKELLDLEESLRAINERLKNLEEKLIPRE